MLRLWKWYQNCLAVHPLKTQVISSGLIWGSGDVAAQSITHFTAQYRLQNQNVVSASLLKDENSTEDMVDGNNELKFDWKRAAKTSFFGFGFVGPVGHLWYDGLDRFIKNRLLMPQNSPRFVATKVAIDGLLFGPLDLLIFFSYMGFAAGKSSQQVKEDVKRDFLPALILEGGLWPLLQVANFRFVPVPYQLLYVNTFCLLDSCFLSWIEQQEDAPWKQWIKSFLPSKEQKDQEG